MITKLDPLGVLPEAVPRGKPYQFHWLGVDMRGYFGIGVHSISKRMNIGSLFRSANAFGADFVFTVSAAYSRSKGRKSDTSDTTSHIPFYSFPDASSMILPEGCKLVGVELIEGAIDLPSFHHPLQAAYLLGPERGTLSSEIIDACDWIIRIPSKFCVNVGVAGAIVMYDRINSLGNFPRRAERPGPPRINQSQHKFGGRFSRSKMETYRNPPPLKYNE